MQNEQWYYARNGQQSGPVSLAELQQLGRQGGLSPQDLVWTPSMGDWQPAATVPGLVPAAPPPLPPPAVALQPAAAYPPPGYPQQYGMPPSYDQRPTDIGQDAGTRWLIPVGRSGWAIAAGYLGLFSVIPLFAPFAVICGLLALRDMKRNPQRHGMGRAIFGIAMGLFGLVLGVAILIAMANSRRY